MSKKMIKGMKRMFIIQVCFFLVFLLIIGTSSKLMGSYKIYTMLSLLGIILIFMLVNSDFTDKTFLVVLLFAIASAVGLIKKHLAN